MSKEVRTPIPNIYAQQEIENFYRFIYENGLRGEAHRALKFIQSRLNLKAKKSSKE